MCAQNHLIITTSQLLLSIASSIHTRRDHGCACISRAVIMEPHPLTRCKVLSLLLVAALCALADASVPTLHADRRSLGMFRWMRTLYWA